MGRLTAYNYCSRCGLKVANPGICAICERERAAKRVGYQMEPLILLTHWIVTTPCAEISPKTWCKSEEDDWTVIEDNCAAGTCQAALSIVVRDALIGIEDRYTSATSNTAIGVL